MLAPMDRLPTFPALAACAVALLAPPALAADDPTPPLLEREKWSFADPAAWQWEGDAEAPILRLTRQSDHKPKVRSPFNLAWFSGHEWESFTLTVEVRLDLFNQGNNDVCIAFGKQSDTRFYYAHLGENADAVHLQLHLVEDADRKSITREGAKTLPWKPETWHQVKLVRDHRSGSIRVWFDEKEVLSASDLTLPQGQIGLGSFDDLGSFRNLRVTAN
jgi:hypothetical protein